MIKIEKLKKVDAPAFRKLYISILKEGFEYYPPRAQIYNSEYWSVLRLTKYISRKNRLLLLAFDGNVPVGYLIGKIYKSGNCSILWMGVLKDLRGQGIGKKLVNYWENWAVKRGGKVLRASTANFDNEKFYTSLGFTKSKNIERNDWGMEKLVFLKVV